MSSINESRIRTRVNTVHDGMYSAQAEGKSIKEYVKGLLKLVGLHKEGMGSSSDFNKEIGSI